MTWLPKKCVVVPFDFSEDSSKTLKAAQEFVTNIDNLHVIHVLQTIIAGEPGMYLESMDNDARRRHAQGAFRERFATSPLGKVDFQVHFGDPGHEIASFAEQLKAEMIIMPSHGRRGLTRLLIGSVAERVVRLAHCPVLILK